jgi:hypothetical protein
MSGNTLKIDLSAAIKIRNEHSFLVKSPFMDGVITAVFIAPADDDSFRRFCENENKGMDEEINLMRSNGRPYSVYIRYKVPGVEKCTSLVEYLEITKSPFNFMKYGLKPLTLLTSVIECIIV